MYTLIIESKYGDQLELTHNEQYDIVSVDGLDPPDAQINETRNAGFDGAVFNSAYLEDRRITITLVVRSPAEENRINLYRYLKTKFPVRVYYKNSTRDVYIDGTVQSFQIDFFANRQTAQIVIVCTNPNFNGIGAVEQEFSNVTGVFEFPFSIESPIEFGQITSEEEKVIMNGGDLETGVLITLWAAGSVTTPMIINSLTNEYLILDVQMQEGDVIQINTRKGEKSATLNRGTITSIVGAIRSGSTWLQLQPGDNVFSLTAEADPGNLRGSFFVVDQYEGV